jgi:hypothetical protein
VSLPVPVPSLTQLVAADVLDADLAALAWLLLEDGVPVLVAGGEPRLRDELLDALIAALPPPRRPDPSAQAGERRLVRVAGAVGNATPAGPLRAALSRTTGRSGLASTIEGSDLADVLAVLRRQGLSDDEISFLGVVLVLGSTSPPDMTPGSGGRVVAAHYLRPVARDAGGHVQRLGPAVLATWDAERGAYDHFEWAIYPELAARTGRRAGDLESEHGDRAERLRSNVPEDPG